MSQIQDINKFLIDQLTNSLNLLAQHQSIGSTHVLYPVSVISGAQQSINQVIQILSAPKPESSEQAPPKESKISPPPEIKK